ncbi:MAG: dihydroxy-acid dehydratase [Alphaproteobacteria bacterium]|jgi:hypothetical protein|nr:dihydroxy-acid dehydratase [Alphaproteobacteria bacterium]
MTDEAPEMSLSPEYHIAIGVITVNGAIMDQLVDAAIWLVMKLPPERGITVTKLIVNTSRKIKFLRDLVEPMFESDELKTQVSASVDALYRLMETGVRPRDIMVREAFENAITTAYAMGGSTNMYLHVLAIAREAGVPLTIEDMQRIGERVPLIANLQPHGTYAMVSLHQVGGVPVVMKALLEAGLLHGDVMTVTGETLAENLADVPLPEDLPEQDVVFPVARPVTPATTSAFCRAHWHRRAAC